MEEGFSILRDRVFSICSAIAARRGMNIASAPVQIIRAGLKVPRGYASRGELLVSLSGPP
eukprot:4660751-Pyramimonas_sp.AAC.1